MYIIAVKNKIFNVSARSKIEALNAVADYLRTLNMHGYFKVAADFVTECDIGESVEEYAATLGYHHCGSRGIYVPIASVKEVAR